MLNAEQRSRGFQMQNVTQIPDGSPAVPLLQALVAAWREEAVGLRRRYGMRQLASLCEAHAAELEEALARSDGRLLTLRVAHLRVLLASGALTQAGRRGAPRVLSSELTRKREARVTFDPAAAARQAVRASSAAARKEASDA
jgi:hypothetical protein